MRNSHHAPSLSSCDSMYRPVERGKKLGRACIVLSLEVNVSFSIISFNCGLFLFLCVCVCVCVWMGPNGAALFPHGTSAHFSGTESSHLLPNEGPQGGNTHKIGRA